MTTVDDAAGIVPEEVKKQEENEKLMAAEEERSFQAGGIDFLAETGPGPVSDYIDVPLNFLRSEGLAQVLRGLTGFLGSLNYAIVDVLVGSYRLFKEKAGGVPVEKS